MTDKNELLRLGEEYDAAADIVKERIAERLRKLRILRAAGKMLTDDAYILKSELNQLYREYNDAVNTASYLKNYYSDKETIEKLLV